MWVHTQKNHICYLFLCSLVFPGEKKVLVKKRLMSQTNYIEFLFDLSTYPAHKSSTFKPIILADCVLNWFYFGCFGIISYFYAEMSIKESATDVSEVSKRTLNLQPHKSITSSLLFIVLLLNWTLTQSCMCWEGLKQNWLLFFLRNWGFCQFRQLCVCVRVCKCMCVSVCVCVCAVICWVIKNAKLLFFHYCVYGNSVLICPSSTNGYKQ